MLIFDGFNIINRINQNHFITDKKIDISIISKNDEFIFRLVKDLNDKGFNVKLIPNLNNFDIGESCDILISNDKNYDVDKTISRLNLIKVLISDDDDSSEKPKKSEKKDIQNRQIFSD